MNGAMYTFDSTAEVQLNRILGLPGVRSPTIRLAGPTRIVRNDSVSPAPGRFYAKTTIVEMNLSGKLLGTRVELSLNRSHSSDGAVEGRADPKSPDPKKPEPIGLLKSYFSVYLRVKTPFGELSNKEPIEMRATIKSIPPDRAKYKQFSPPRDLYDKIFRTIAAQMQCAVHSVTLVGRKPHRSRLGA